MSKFKCGLCKETSTFEEVDKANKEVYGVVRPIQELINEEILEDHYQWCPKCNREIDPRFVHVVRNNNFVKRISNEIVLEVSSLMDGTDVFFINYQEDGVEPNIRVVMSEVEVENFVAEVEQYIRRKRYLRVL